MDHIDFEKLVEQSTHYLKACNAKANARYGIEDYASFEYDLVRKEIWWSDESGPKLRGKLTVVGTFSSQSDTWLWAWGNSHFDDVELGPIQQVREFGEREGLPKLTDAQWPAEEIDGWEMTSISARLLETQGAYRAPGANGSLFLLYDDLDLIPEDELSHYLPLSRPDTVDSWPFDQGPDVAALTSTHITRDRDPILLVTHYDDDDSWAFLSGKPVTVEEGQIVAMEEICNIDHTVSEIADLEPGWSASREFVGGPWTRYRDEEEAT